MRVRSYKAIRELVYDGFPDADFPYPIRKLLTTWFEEKRKVSIFNTIRIIRILKPCLYIHSGKEMEVIFDIKNEINSDDGLSYCMNPEKTVIIVYI